MTRLRTLAIALAVVVSASPLIPARSTAGPLDFQASGGWYTESEDFFVGAGARFSLGTISVTPNAEVLFVSGGSAFTVNVDGTLSIVPLGVADIYGGLGLGLFYLNPDGFPSDTRTAVNLIAGAGFDALPLKPFGQLKWVIVEGDDPLVLALGIRF